MPLLRASSTCFRPLSLRICLIKRPATSSEPCPIPHSLAYPLSHSSELANPLTPSASAQRDHPVDGHPRPYGDLLGHAHLELHVARGHLQRIEHSDLRGHHDLAVLGVAVLDLLLGVLGVLEHPARGEHVDAFG